MEEPQSTTTAITLEAINSKLDQILAYQRSARHWAIARSVLNIVLFLVFVVFPIVGAYYLIQGFVSQVDLSKLANQYNQAAGLLDEVSTMKGQVSDGAVQELMKKIPGLNP